MPHTKINITEHIDDEVINVTLARKDYNTLREMIEKQQSLSWMGKYVKSVLFVFAGGILTLVTFGEQILGVIKGVLGIH